MTYVIKKQTKNHQRHHDCDHHHQAHDENNDHHGRCSKKQIKEIQKNQDEEYGNRVSIHFLVFGFGFKI